MYIEPNTNIRLLSNVPLDTTYEHTIFFSSAENQRAFFQGKTKYNLNNYTYQRVQRGWIRVGINAEDLYDCNYVMFQNTGFGNKWFYAFITAVEYVNNQCSQVSFEIDVMQTWLLDYTLEYCFVDREHTATDVIGEHIEPEGVECGEYVFNDYGVPLNCNFSNLAIVVLVVDENRSEGSLYNGVFGGATMRVFNASDYDSVVKYINVYEPKPDSVVSIYMSPTLAFPAGIPSGGINIISDTQATFVNGRADGINGTEGLDGYAPKNKKMYTYPYNFYCLDNGAGQSLNLRYEFFDNLTPTWRITVPFISPIECTLRPTNYKGGPGDGTFAHETISLSGFPQCSWTVDTYKNWIANNAFPIAINNIASTTSAAVMGLAMGGTIGASVMSGISMLTNVTNTMSQSYKASIQADMSKGNLNAGISNVAAKKQFFSGGRMSVNKVYAKMIDDYFTMFGYAIRQCKVPNRNVRPHWTYCKTIGCNIVGSVPADDARRICEIYDHGITWWLNGNEVGNYNLDNRV